MKCFPACLYLYLLLNLNFPDVVYGNRHASCIRCFCKTGKSKCELENNKCACIKDRMYLNNSTRCVVHPQDCGLHNFRTRVKPGCLPCQCSRGSDHCDLIGSECTCREGSIYFTGSANRCVSNIEECRTLYSITSTCAKCTCPRGHRNCHRPGNKCECINGKYYMPDSDECVRNDEDCIFPKPSHFDHSTCAKCTCPPHKKTCHLLGNKCDCINGTYYMRGSKKCVHNRGDCIFGNPTRFEHSTCAKCTCPPHKKTCHLLGNKCDCINGTYYMRGSKKCVQNRGDCIFGNPTSNCAKCACSLFKRKCNLLDSKCSCIDGIAYMPGSEKCAENEADCFFGNPMRRADVDSNETPVIIVENDR